MPPRQQQGGGGPGLPFAGDEGKFFALQKFQGLNTQAQRPAIEDEEFSWLENFMPIGDGNLRTVPSNGSTIYTASAGTTIVYMFFYNIASNTFVGVFQSDGTAFQVNTVTLGVTAISNVAGTFYGGGDLPACAQWGNSGILITSTVTTDGYWAWDGTTLFPPGSASPSWLNGGVATTMPHGLSGNAIETFNTQAWVFNGSTGNFSGPGNGANFSGAVGGGSFTSSDSFLRRTYTQAKNVNGFLYVFADSSINVISNPQTSGSPPTTTFKNLSVDPQIGTPWHNSVQIFEVGKVLFANQNGVFQLAGGAAAKISDKLDGIFAEDTTFFAQANPTAQPSSAVCTLYGQRIYMLLVPINDLFTGQQRKVCVAFNGKKWFLISQDSSLLFIATQEINSVLTAWGTDGNTVFQMFATATNTLKKIWQTKLWAGDGFVVLKTALRDYLLAIDNAGSGYSVSLTVDTISENTGLQTISQTFTSNSNPIIWLGLGNAVLQWTGLAGALLNFTSAGTTLNGQNANGASGALMGITAQSTSTDFTIVAFALLYRNMSPVGG